MIFGIPPGVFIFTLIFGATPHVLLLWFMVASFKRWKRPHDLAPAWKAAFISSIPAFFVLILMSLKPMHETLFGPPDPFFFIPLVFGMLYLAIPVALEILMVVWCLLIVLMAKRGEISKVQIDNIKEQCMLPIILTMVIIFGIILFTVTQGY